MERFQQRKFEFKYKDKFWKLLKPLVYIILGIFFLLAFAKQSGVFANKSYDYLLWFEMIIVVGIAVLYFRLS